MVVIQESLKEARAANKLSQDANAASDAQFRIAERPWLTRDSVVFRDLRGNEMPTLTNGVPVVVRMVLKNTGRSPALAIDAYACVRIEKRDIDVTRAVCKDSPVELGSSDVAVDDIHWVHVGPHTFTTEQLELMRSETQMWFFWGATYTPYICTSFLRKPTLPGTVSHRGCRESATGAGRQVIRWRGALAGDG